MPKLSSAADAVFPFYQLKDYGGINFEPHLRALCAILPDLENALGHEYDRGLFFQRDRMALCGLQNALDRLGYGPKGQAVGCGPDVIHTNICDKLREVHDCADMAVPTLNDYYNRLRATSNEKRDFISRYSAFYNGMTALHDLLDGYVPPHDHVVKAIKASSHDNKIMPA